MENIKNTDTKWLVLSKTYKLVNGVSVKLEIRDPFETEYRAYISTEQSGGMMEYKFFHTIRGELNDSDKKINNTMATKFYNSFNREMALEWYLENLLNRLEQLTKK